MSTKIYYGFRLPAGVRLREFHAMLLERIGEQTDLLELSVLARQIFRVVTGSNAERSGTLLAVASNELVESRSQETANSVFREPYYCSVSYGRHPETGQVYGILHTNTEEYHQIALELGAEDYSYWNNGDHPDTVTISEWEDRRRAWAAVCPTGIPARSMTLLSELGLPSRARDESSLSALLSPANLGEEHIETLGDFMEAQRDEFALVAVKEMLAQKFLDSLSDEDRGDGPHLFSNIFTISSYVGDNIPVSLLNQCIDSLATLRLTDLDVSVGDVHARKNLPNEGQAQAWVDEHRDALMGIISR